MSNTLHVNRDYIIPLFSTNKNCMQAFPCIYLAYDPPPTDINLNLTLRAVQIRRSFHKITIKTT